MKAADVMVSKVITVRPDVSVHDVARVLLANRISAVPVVGDDQELLGIVSEGDLLRRVEAGTQRGGSWWVARQTASIRQVLAEDFVKSRSQKVSDVMTRYVITAEPDTPLTEIVSLFETNHIKRVPIVENERVIGIVSRANILQILASISDEGPITTTPEDAAVRDNILASLNEQPWIRASLVNITVHDGVVDVWGIVASAAEKNAVRVAAEITPGVQRVNDYLTVHAAPTEI